MVRTKTDRGGSISNETASICALINMLRCTFYQIKITIKHLYRLHSLETLHGPQQYSYRWC